jgi:hypothetical protein
MTDKKKPSVDCRGAELFPIGNSGFLGKIISFFLGRKRR